LCHEKKNKIYEINTTSEVFALLGCYAAQIGIYLPTFRDELSVPSSSVQQFLKMGPLCCPETSVNNYQSAQRKMPGKRRSHSHRSVSLKSRINSTGFKDISVFSHNII
jgi:hypothetical protein